MVGVDLNTHNSRDFGGVFGQTDQLVSSRLEQKLFFLSFQTFWYGPSPVMLSFSFTENYPWNTIIDGGTRASCWWPILDLELTPCRPEHDGILRLVRFYRLMTIRGFAIMYCSIWNDQTVAWIPLWDCCSWYFHECVGTYGSRIRVQIFGIDNSKVRLIKRRPSVRSMKIWPLDRDQPLECV